MDYFGKALPNTEFNKFELQKCKSSTSTREKWERKTKVFMFLFSGDNVQESPTKFISPSIKSLYRYRYKIGSVGLIPDFASQK